MMQKQVCHNHIEARRTLLEKIENIGGLAFHSPTENGKLLFAPVAQKLLAVEQGYSHITPARHQPPRYGKHQGPVSRPDLQYGTRLAVPPGTLQRPFDDRRMTHEQIQAFQVVAGAHGAPVVGGQRIEPFGLNPPRPFHGCKPSGELCLPLRNRIVSATRPGPNAMANPVASGRAERRISARTKTTVADDMLPNRLSTSRDAQSDCAGNSKARATASSTVRPPG